MEGFNICWGPVFPGHAVYEILAICKTVNLNINYTEGVQTLNRTPEWAKPLKIHTPCVEDFNKIFYRVIHGMANLPSQLAIATSSRAVLPHMQSNPS